MASRNPILSTVGTAILLVAIAATFLFEVMGMAITFQRYDDMGLPHWSIWASWLLDVSTVALLAFPSTRAAGALLAVALISMNCVSFLVSGTAAPIVFWLITLVGLVLSSWHRLSPQDPMTSLEPQNK